MDKIWLIVKREYLTRVLKKSFLLITILAPVAIATIAVFAGYLASTNSSSKKAIALIDDNHIISAGDIESSSLDYVMVAGDINEVKKTYQEDGYDILVQVPKIDSMEQTSLSVNYYTKEKLSLMTIKEIEGNIRSKMETYKLDQSAINKEQLDRLKLRISLENALLTDSDETLTGDKSSKFSSIIATGLSYLMGFLMYMVIFIFGSMVMRSVMEEKINRIVEVMISSVKPFQLMIGKVLGVGLVGLTQLLIWMILLPVIMYFVNMMFGTSVTPNTGNMAQAGEVITELQTQGNNLTRFMTEIKSMNWWKILPSFIVFFFGGYFLYSAMFAAVGSAIGDDLGEGQQMMLPIIVPVIIAFIMIPSIFNNPNGNLAIFASMFPLFSPIIMPARLPFDPPTWQILLSIVFLIGGVIVTTWLAAKIYRVGIFMYGKKLSFKEIGKWLFYKP